MPKAPAASGQATPLVALALLLGALLLVPLALVARATIERSHAQNAADAAALAGALAGEREAEVVAARNGARLLAYERRGDTVEVVVGVGDRRATARAERSAVPRPPAGSTTHRDPTDTLDP